MLLQSPILVPREWNVWTERKGRLRRRWWERSSTCGREGLALRCLGLGLLTVSRRLQEVGRMKIELFADVVPKTAENFR